MAFVIACGNGHRWEWSVEDGTGPIGPTPCPMCGLLCDPRETVAVGDSDSKPMSRLGGGSGSTSDSRPSTIGFPISPSGELPEIPGYLLLSRLGHGAMGVVYKADHLQLHRPVAIKMILSGSESSPQQLIRFQIEAEALARLQHPNIVQIFDVDTYRDCPYFVMELVTGGSLADRIAEGPFRPDEAAALIEKIAAGVHVAHSNGIIHRDLKPGNILLHRTGDRLEPKITDFGLAKRLGDLDQTRVGAILGTPRYMAPEQAGGDPRAIGPASDVFALGVIFYELLAGTFPFAGKSVVELLEQVRIRQPAPPSRLRSVPRDLDVICLKCLEKNPQARYRSADELAQDIRRYLNGEPIRARAVRWPERLAKWSRRRPALAGLVSVACLSACVIAGLVVWKGIDDRRNEVERNRQREQYVQRVRNALDRVADKVVQRWSDLPHKDAFLQEILVETASDYEELAREDSSDPDVRRQAAEVLLRLGRIQHQLNRFDQAGVAIDKARNLYSDLHQRFPADPRFVQGMAQALTMLGETIREEGRRPITEAEPFYRQALELQQSLVSSVADAPSHRLERARSHYNLGIVAMETDRSTLAGTEFGQAIDLLQELGPNASPEARHELARCLINRGALNKSRKLLEAAQQDYLQALDLFAQLPKERRDRPIVKFETGLAHQNLGNSKTTQGKLDDARASLEKSRTLLEDLVRDFPDRTLYRIHLATNDNGLAAAQALGKDYAEAEKTWLRGCDQLRELIRLHPENRHFQYELALVWGNLGWLMEQQKDYDKAAENVDKAIRLLKTCVDADAENSTYRLALRNQYRASAEFQLQLKNAPLAAAAATAMAEVFPDQAQYAYYAACFLARSADCSPPDAKASLCDRSIEMLRRAGQRKTESLQRLDDEEMVFRIVSERPDYVAAMRVLGPSREK